MVIIYLGEACHIERDLSGCVNEINIGIWLKQPLLSGLNALLFTPLNANGAGKVTRRFKMLKVPSI